MKHPALLAIILNLLGFSFAHAQSGCSFDAFSWNGTTGTAQMGEYTVQATNPIEGQLPLWDGPIQVQTQSGSCTSGALWGMVVAPIVGLDGHMISFTTTRDNVFWLETIDLNSCQIIGRTRTLYTAPAISNGNITVMGRPLPVPGCLAH